MQLCGVLLLAFTLFAVSAIVTPGEVRPPEKQPERPAETPDPVIREEVPYHAVIEYGTPEIIKNNSGPLFAYIRFPQAGNSTDRDISEWANRFYSDRLIEFQIRQEDEPGALGEINVHFDSYLIDSKYAGVYQSGDYSYSLLMPPEPVVVTFNIDLTANKILKNDDILDFSHTNDIIAPLLLDRLLTEHPRTDGYLNFIDESWLTNLVISDTGIMAVIEKGTFLPGFDTLTVTLPYEDLGEALILDIGAQPVQTPAPTPAPTPDPDDGDPDDGNPPTPPPPQLGDIDPTRPIIALSFDDGPGIYTDEFLDLFEEYGIRATFCVIGNLVNTQTDALARAVEMGSEVIGHSWDHKNLAKLTADDVRKQLIDTRDVIVSATGVATPLFRPPYGETNDTVKEVAAELGLSLINWNVDPEDWNTHDSDAVYEAVLQQVKNNAIILSHEIYKSTLIAYQRLIPELLTLGYQIVTVSELIYFRDGGFEPGKVYYNG